MHQWLKQSTRGFTLIEMAIVLTLVGLVVAGVWVYTAQVNYNSKKKRVLEQVVQIMNSSKKVFGNADGGLTGNITSAAITAGIFPGDMVANSAATTATHALGGAAVLSVGDGCTPPCNNGTYLRLSLDGLPPDICTAVLSTFLGSSAVITQFNLMGYQHIEDLSNPNDTGPVTGQGNGFGGGNIPNPVTVGEAATACAGPYIDVALDFNVP